MFFPGGGGGTPRGTEQDVPEDLEETEEWGEEMEAAGEVGTVPGVADDSDESAMESDDGSESQSDFGEEDDDEEEERVYAALAAGKTVNTLEVQTGLVTALIWALHRTGVPLSPSQTNGELTEPEENALHNVLCNLFVFSVLRGREPCV